MKESRCVVIVIDPAVADPLRCATCEEPVWAVVDGKRLLIVSDNLEQSTIDYRVMEIHRCAKPVPHPLTGEEACRG